MRCPMFLLIGCLANCVHAAAMGSTLYVSKLGDNSDGSSWPKAFQTIQGALNAVPDDKGGHRIVIRPDTYMEANLFPAHKGAQGAYNTLEADFDGALGSGTTGYAVIDSSDPAKGFQSIDWWSTFKANPDFSCAGWDRWTFRRLYATGGDAGLFWDLTNEKSPFTVVVEDSVGIGRAFGGGAGNYLPRPEEPLVFRRCQLWCLDWWGDAAGAYVRAENETMQDKPDATFEDCALVGPDDALKSGNPGFASSTRVLLKNCRLISLNFSQPQGTPSRGVIYSVIDGSLMHVDLEDCTLMGYKVFGAGKNEIGYTTKGSCRAYVQFQQEVPKGFLRIGYWPPEVFQSILPPPRSPVNERKFVKDPKVVHRDMCEVSPLIWKDRLCRMECVRPASGGTSKDYYLQLIDVDSGAELARFAEGYSLASALVNNGVFYVFASRFESNDWNDVTVFKSADLKNWDKKVAITQDAKEHLFNSSVCPGPDGFVMAYETNDPTWPAFTVKFAVSKDLETWTKLPDAIFGKDRYTACPCVRFADGYYYLMYAEHRTPRWFFEVYIARSKDLKDWELSGANPMLTADQLDEGIDASDPDIVEFGGKTYVYYSVGDQLTWMNIKQAIYPGPMNEFLGGWFKKK